MAKGSLNPNFNETLQMNVDDPEAPILVEVKDWNFASNISMGEATISNPNPTLTLSEPSPSPYPDPCPKPCPDAGPNRDQARPRSTSTSARPWRSRRCASPSRTSAAAPYTSV